MAKKNFVNGGKRPRKVNKKTKHWNFNGGEPKRGMYKGIWCDSSWELAFLMYHLDKGIPIERNSKGFSYQWDGKKHYWFPDFFIDNQTYYEVKGVMDKKNKNKFASFKYPLEVISDKEINLYLDYAKKKYGEKFYRFYED